MQSHGIYLPVSVNVTADILVDQDYMNQLVKVISPYARFIHIEITEETLLSDETLVAAAFNRLHQMGVKVHIDDFGTGFSSLSYLNKFDVDVLKVDRSFVLALVTGKGRKVFGSILSIAKELGLEVVVEGVESQEQLDLIPKEQSIAVQGWYYAKSLPINRLIEYVLK
jgi:EAL domain-containing protein (putative c-di-GMP-specific phosphodiesterase class I)